MKKIVLFLELSSVDKILIIEALLFLGISRIFLFMFEFKKIAPHLGEHMQKSLDENRESDRAKAIKVSWAISLMSRHTFWESKCMVQAMTAKMMLKRRRIKSTLYLGVAKNDTRGFIAHAWVSCGDFIVTGAKGMNQFTIVSMFGD